MAASEVAESYPREHPRVQAALNQLRDLLVPGERLEAWAVQRRLFALIHRRIVIGATSGRLVAMYRGLFGGFRLHDVRWQDLKDAQLRVGIFASDLVLASLGSADLAVASQAGAMLTFTGLRHQQAQDVYRMCQAQEQAWREKRRVRELEELRAKSGGIHLGSTGMAGVANTAAAIEDPVARLQRAKELLDKGLITDAEYEALKAKIVSGL